MPIIAGTFEVVDGSLFDTVWLDRQRTNMFCISVGQMIQPPDQHHRQKTWDETNMVQTGMLPVPQKLQVSQITAALFRDGKPLPLFGKDVSEMWTRCSIKFMLMAKEYGTFTPFQIADPKCFIGGADPDKIRELLKEFPDLMAPLGEIIMIEHAECFSIEVFVDVPDPTIQLQVRLLGQLFRPMQ